MSLTSPFIENCDPFFSITPVSKWLGSPPYISHEKAICKGNNPILRGLTITMVINHLQVMG